MREIAYLFERFPSFGQTFCYREVAELERQGTKVHVFSIRRPKNEPPQDWDEQIVRRVHYLPDEDALVREVDLALKAGTGAPGTPGTPGAQGTGGEAPGDTQKGLAATCTDARVAMLE